MPPSAGALIGGRKVGSILTISHRRNCKVVTVYVSEISHFSGGFIIALPFGGDTEVESCPDYLFTFSQIQYQKLTSHHPSEAILLPLSNSAATTFSWATNRQASQPPFFSPTPAVAVTEYICHLSSSLPLRSGHTAPGNHTRQRVKRIDPRTFLDHYQQPSRTASFNSAPG